MTTELSKLLTSCLTTIKNLLLYFEKTSKKSPVKISFGQLNPMVFIFLNLFDLLECPVMLMTLILVITLSQQNFSNMNIDIINFVRGFFKILSAAF